MKLLSKGKGRLLATTNPKFQKQKQNPLPSPPTKKHKPFEFPHKTHVYTQSLQMCLEKEL
jgi:hypothetical protein